MLRGVNRQIIEVKDTGSRYFERALLIVRPEFAHMQPGQLEREADKYLASVGRPPALRPAASSRRPHGPHPAPAASGRSGAFVPGSGPVRFTGPRPVRFWGLRENYPHPMVLAPFLRTAVISAFGNNDCTAKPPWCSVHRTSKKRQ